MVELQKQLAFINETHGKEVKYAFFDEEFICNLRNELQRTIPSEIYTVCDIERVKLLR